MCLRPWIMRTVLGQCHDLVQIPSSLRRTAALPARGGVVVQLEGVSQLGFVPYSRMDATRVPEVVSGKSVDMGHLVGEPISTKIIQAGTAPSDVPRRRRSCGTARQMPPARLVNSIRTMIASRQSAGCSLHSTDS